MLETRNLLLSVSVLFFLSDTQMLLSFQDLPLDSESCQDDNDGKNQCGLELCLSPLQFRFIARLSEETKRTHQTSTLCFSVLSGEQLL